MQQLSLFNVGRRPPLRMPVDPDGTVISHPAVVHRLPHPTMAWPRAEIRLHPHEDGRWMWATSWHGDSQGGGYGVGTKHGKYAECREDALYYAACELEGIVQKIEGVAASLILKWAVSLKENPEAAE